MVDILNNVLFIKGERLIAYSITKSLHYSSLGPARVIMLWRHWFIDLDSDLLARFVIDAANHLPERAPVQLFDNLVPVRYVVALNDLIEAAISIKTEVLTHAVWTCCQDILEVPLLFRLVRAEEVNLWEFEDLLPLVLGQLHNLVGVISEKLLPRLREGQTVSFNWAIDSRGVVIFGLSLLSSLEGVLFLIRVCIIALLMMRERTPKVHWEGGHLIVILVLIRRCSGLLGFEVANKPW